MTAIESHAGTPRRFTVQEYHRLVEVGILREDDRTELINGEIIQMSPIGRRHASMVARLTDHFSKLGPRALVWVQNPVQIDAVNEPKPDIALLRRRADYYEDVEPKPADVFLIVEVGDSTLTYDLNVKRRYYAEHGIFEVWIVDAVSKAIRVGWSPAGDHHADDRLNHSTVTGHESACAASRGVFAPTSFPMARQETSGRIRPGSLSGLPRLHATMSCTTRPFTSVNRKSRPAKR